jgi:HTH-type transcriptional regulator, sugar sensing transcriptional regulator
MLKELQDIGLSEKEARVYTASLELGPATADRLAKHAKVNRSTTYVQLESLMKEGLMSTFEEGKKTFFTPESPELLRRLIEKQKDQMSARERDLSRILPLLLRQFEGAGERPLVRFFPGAEGVHSVREEVLSTKEKKTFSLTSVGLLSKLYDQSYLDDYSDRRRALGIHSQAIYIHEAYFEIAGLDKLTERRFIPPEELALTIDITVFDDKCAIYSLKGSLFAMVIESKQISHSMRMIFDYLWNHAQGPTTQGSQKK